MVEVCLVVRGLAIKKNTETEMHAAFASIGHVLQLPLICYIMSDPPIYDLLFAEFKATMPNANNIVNSAALEGRDHSYPHAPDEEALRLS